VRLSGALVSSNLFSILGAHALLGRTFDPRDEAPGSDALVISEDAWHRYFQGDPAIIGRTVALKTQGPEAGLPMSPWLRSSPRLPRSRPICQRDGRRRSIL
jgi:hypothetical protein